MKILIINTYCKKGSIGKIAYGLFLSLQHMGHECVLLYGGDEKYPDEPQLKNITSGLETQLHNKLSYITGLQGLFSPIATVRAKRIIDEFQPDIVQLFNLHGDFINIFQILKYVKDYPVVYSMLDEYPFLGHCCYSFDCKKYETECVGCTEPLNQYPRSVAFRTGHRTLKMKRRAYDAIKNKIFVGPQWVVDCARKSSLLRNEKLKIVDEFIDTENIFYPKDTTKIAKKLGIETAKLIVLNVAPASNPRKGIKFYIEMAKKLQKEDIIFVHVGMDVDLKDLPSNYIAIGYVDNQETLADFYSLADLFVCTSIADTMPNVCLDALACGTPVLGFDISGIPYVAEEPIGKFVDACDIDKMLDVIRKTPKKNATIMKACREYACERYSLKTYSNKMKLIYQEMLNGEKR